MEQVKKIRRIIVDDEEEDENEAITLINYQDRESVGSNPDYLTDK
jgi:hypothetical protein